MKPNLKLIAPVFIAMICSFAAAQQTVTAGPYMLQIETESKAIPIGGKTTLDLFVMDGKSMAPISGLKITGSLDMPEMGGMNLAAPMIKAGSQPGHYDIFALFPMKGEYKLDLKIKPSKGEAVNASLTLSPSGDKAAMKTGSDQMAGMSGMSDMQMKGSLGDWSMSREGSGTSWMPDSSPMYMKMLPKSGKYDLSLMGEIQGGYVDAGGKRGESQIYANSMIMYMGRRETAGGTLGLDLMMSLDPLTNGKHGVPNLFQTGETLNGKPLVDRQHPHDLIAEAAASFSKPVGHGDRAFVYAAPIGEPALGGPMFMHRPSGMEIPEAPISHHWFDSTHISFGVVTLGVALKDKLKFEASSFNGHEPDENRYAIDPIGLNSASGRVTYNPDPNLSLSASYGYLQSPEALESGVNQHRITASAMHNRTLSNGDNFASTLYFGRLIVAGKRNSNAIAFETTFTHNRDSLFARFENVDKDELIGVPAGSYKVSKLLLGDVHNFQVKDGFEYGLGGYVGLYSFPKALDTFYGNHPMTWGVYLRIRPGRM
jgi:hypothetical protein